MVPASALQQSAVAIGSNWATVVAQFEPGPATDPAPAVPWFVETVVAALLTLAIGGLLVALAPDYVRRVTDHARGDPVAAFGWGFGIGVAIFAVAIVLGLTGIGLIIAIPILLALIPIGILTSTLGYLAVGRSAGDDWGTVLIVAAAVAGFVAAVPILGALVGFVVATVGLGAFVMDLRA